MKPGRNHQQGGSVAQEVASELLGGDRSSLLTIAGKTASDDARHGEELFGDPSEPMEFGTNQIVNHAPMDTAIAEAKASGIGVIAMKVARPVYAGPNRKPAAPQSVADLQEAIPGDWTIPQKAYLWALKNPNLSAVISNMVNLEQTRANLKLPAVNTAKED